MNPEQEESAVEHPHGPNSRGAPGHTPTPPHRTTADLVTADGTTLPGLTTLVQILDAELAATALPVADETTAQLIRFAVGDAVFAMAAEQLIEVDSVPPITFVPRAPAAVLGLTNLRGEVIVVIDLSHFLGLGQRQDARHHSSKRMIVLRDAGRGRPGGVIVDRVFGISPYAPETMTPPTHEVPALAVPFVAGCVALEGYEVAVLDLGAIAVAATAWPEDAKS